MRPSVSKSFLALALAAGLCPSASLGQKNNKENHPAPPPRVNRPNAQPPRANAPGRPNGQPGPRGNHPNVAMPDAVGRWNAMTADEQKRALAKMPPEQQKRFLERIDRFNHLPKDEQLRQTERLERFNRLPPAEKQQIRKQFQQFNNLPPDRKQALDKELGRLSKMTDEQRSEYLASEQFQKRFPPGEQEILRSLAKVTPHQK